MRKTRKVFHGLFKLGNLPQASPLCRRTGTSGGVMVPPLLTIQADDRPERPMLVQKFGSAPARSSASQSGIHSEGFITFATESS